MKLQYYKINIKVIAGKSGHEIVKFSQKSNADLLIMNAPDHKLGLLDRVFPHHHEIVMADLPCNLLILHQSQQ